METQGNGHSTNGSNGAAMAKMVARTVKPEVFGKALHDARMEQRIGVPEICKSMKITAGTLHRWERGESVPQARYLAELRKRFPGLPHVRASEQPIPLFATPPPVLASREVVIDLGKAVVAKHLAKETTTATLGDYAEAVGRVEAARRALDNAVEEAEAIHAALMGRVRA